MTSAMHFVKAWGCSGKAERKDGISKVISINSEAKKLLVLGPDGDVKVSILQVYGCKPISLMKEWKDGLQSHHLELGRCDEGVDASQV